MRRPLAVLLVVLALVAGLVAAPASSARAAPRTGLLRLVLLTPSGVPANVVIRGGARPLVVAKAPKGARVARALRLRPGRYRLEVPVVTARGVRYTGEARAVVLLAGRAARATVRLRAEGGASRLAATASRTAVSLRWHAPRGAVVALRRAVGSTPPTTVRVGAAVRTVGSGATDHAVRAGTAYAYALFTRQGGRWLGPATARLQTPARTTTSSSYVAAPDTAFMTSAQVRSVRGAGGGVAVALSADAPRPVIGAAVVLPPSLGLAGGYIGLVAGFAADGSVLLTPGGLGDALTTYDLSSAAFSSDSNALPLDRVEATLARRSVPLHGFSASSVARMHRADVAPTGPITCEGGAKPTLALTRRLTIGGSFHLTGDMSNPARPTARVISSTYLEGQLSLSGQLKAEATCSLELPSVATTVMAGPVPIAIAIDPVVQAKVSGAVTFGGLGFTFRSGFATSRTLTMTPNGIETGGSETPIRDLHQLQPTVDARTDVEVRVGGDLEVGPGVSSSIAGVSAGIHAELDIVKGTFGVAAGATAAGPSLCVHFAAGLRAVVGLYARAFLKVGFFSVDLKGDVDLPPFEVPFGREISAPEGCTLDKPIVVGAAAATGGGTAGGGGESTYTGSGGGGWGDPGAAALPTTTGASQSARPLGDGATTALPADAGDRTGSWSTLTGHVPTDTTLGSDAQHSGWILDGVTVDPGATLTIVAGTRLRIVDHRWYDGSLEPSVRVDGAVDIEGTADDPVLMGSLNDLRVGGTTGRENPYPDRSPSGWNYQAFSGAGDVRIVHAYVADAAALGAVSGATDIEATGFDSGTRLSGMGTSFALRQVRAAGLQVTGGNATIEDAALSDSTLDLWSGALRDVALTGTSHLQVEGPDVGMTRTSIAAASLPVSGTIGAIGADFSGLSSPDGVPWLSVSGGTVPVDMAASASLPIAFTGIVTVPAGVTLTVPHGALLAFTPGNGWYGAEHESVIVAGRLVSSGTGAAPIFTARDDTALPVDMSRQNEFGWDGVRIESGGVVDLTDADLRGRVAVWSGGSLALHGRVATADSGGTSIQVSAGGEARLDGVTGDHLSLGGAPGYYSIGTSGSGGNGRLRITDSSLTDSSILLPTADSTLDRTTLKGAGTSLGALPTTVNAVGDVRFADGAADEVRLQESPYPIGAVDQHWTETTVPIRVDSMLSIDSGGSLTIDPGVTLRLGPCRWGYGSTNSCIRLTGSGALHLLGGTAAPVRLMPQLVTGDPNQILPWQGIDAEGQSIVELRHVRTALAQEILRSADSAAVTVDDLQHEQDVGSPLFFNGSSTPATVTGSPGIG